MGTDRSRSCRKKFIRQSGCIVRDHIPISFRLWKASNPSEERDAIPEREKEWCWRELKKNFTVPAESEEICKRWTLSKMAEQLQSFKKILTKKYIKTGTTPVFTARARKAQGSLGCICGIQVFRAWASEGAEGQRQHLEESVPSHSRPRMLQACNTQLREDGAGSA